MNLRFYEREIYDKAKELANSISAITAQTLGDGDIFYVYIFDAGQLHQMPINMDERKLLHNYTFTFNEINPGKYDVELWDCYEGKIIKNIPVTVDDNKKMTIVLPDFRIHCALKIRRKK